MSLTLVVGDMGSGKTLFTTWLALQSKVPVYANYSISCDTYHALNPSCLVTLDKESLVIIDEAYIWLESRTSSKNLNRFMSYILFQSRKRGLDIILIAQLLSSIDVRFRNMAEKVVECRRDESGDFQYTVHKISQTEVYNPVVLTLTQEKAAQIFPYYDTLEIIATLDRDLTELAITDQAELLPEVDGIVKELLKVHKARDYTKAAVQDYCTEKGLGKVYVDLIYNRIKARQLR